MCESGKVCVEGKCRPLCGDEEFLCSGVCVNPRQDTKNCGVCGKACGARERCEGGRCVEECVGEGVARCEDRCVDTRQDAKHCGACGKACEIGQRCEGGNCLCAGGLLGCGGDGCVDLTADARHCGACGKSCGTGEVCVAGSCFQGTCPASTATACLGGCVDLSTNRLHCGTCGSACSSQKRCQGSACICPTGLLDCGGDGCVDAQRDRRHCGGCGQACAAGQVCAAGACVASCPTSTATACLGGCVDTQSDPLHCGGCGKACAPGLGCREGVCCETAFAVCGGACVDPQNSVEHCGGCGKACPVGSRCQEGACCKEGCAFAVVMGGRLSDHADAVVVDAQGFVYVAGAIASSDADLAGLRLPRSISVPTVFVLKMDAEGQGIWLRLFYGEAGTANTARGLALGPQGGVFLTGSFTGKLTADAVSLVGTGAAEDVYVVKMDKDGKPLWGVGLGGTGADRGYAVAVDREEHVTVVGETKSPRFGGVDLPNQRDESRGDNDLFVAHLVNQKLVWLFAGGGLKADYILDVKVDVKGEIYVAGGMGAGVARIGALTFSNPADTALLVKLDRNGNAVWHKRFTEGDAFGLAVREEAGGMRVCFGGWYAGSLLLDEVSLVDQGKQTAYVGCVDGQGKVLWARSLLGQGSERFDYARSVAFDTRGNLHVAGMFTSPQLRVESTILRNRGEFDIFLARYDAKGGLLMAENYGGSLSDYIEGIAVGPKGSSYLVGSSYSTNFEVKRRLYKNLGLLDGVLLHLGP